MKTTNFTNVIANQDEIFFMIEYLEASILYNGSIDKGDMEFLNRLNLSFNSIQFLEERIVNNVTKKRDKNNEYSLNELLAIYVLKTFSELLPSESNCYVFYVKDDMLKYVGNAKIKDLEDGIDTSLNMINDFIYN